MIRDDGTGGCTFAESKGGSVFPIGPFQTCEIWFPGAGCASYQGSLTLTSVYNGSSPFVDPDFQTHLNTIGLGSVTALLWLHIYILHLAPIPRGIELAFLPDLTLIKDQLRVSECPREGIVQGVCESSAPKAAERSLIGLTATSNVYRVPDIFIDYTNLTDMMFLKGLQCPPSSMQLSGNTKLVSFRGLEGIQAWTKDSIGPVINYKYIKYI
jgi:hypothetical protein